MKACVWMRLYVQQTFLRVVSLFVQRSKIRKDEVSRRDSDPYCRYLCVPVYE